MRKVPFLYNATTERGFKHMAHCFLIQPFDGGKFDKRYEDVFAPAITAAGLEPYRVDRDPGVTIPIDEIHRGITTAVACLVDITTDNPNVWFELGVAIASQRLVVIVCSKERTTPFPFDVQHLSIIKYATDSSSDFDKLKEDITVRLKALLTKEQQLERVASISSVAKVQGLQAHEIAALVCVAQELNAPDGGVAAYTVRQGMEAAGFTKLAATLALHSLIEKAMVEAWRDSDYNGNEFFAYRLMEAGVGWLSLNQDKLPLRTEKSTETNTLPDLTDQDIPF